MRRGARAGGREGGESGEGDVAFLAQAVARMGRTVGALLGASARAHDAVLRLAHGLRAHARETGALERQLAAAEREASALQRVLLASTARRWPTGAAEDASAGGAVREAGQRVARTPGYEDDASAFAPSPSDAPPAPTLASGSAHAFAQTSDSASDAALDPSSVAGSTLIAVCDRAVELVSGAASVPAAVSGTPSVLPSVSRSNYALAAASGPGCTRASDRASVYVQDAASGPACGSVAGHASALTFAPAPGAALVSAPTSTPSSASSAASGLAPAAGPAAAYTLTSTACPPVLTGQASGTAFASDLAAGPAYVCTRSSELDRSFVSVPTSARLSASGSADLLLGPASGPESTTPFVAAAASAVRAAAADGSAPLLSSAFNLHHVSTAASSVPDRCIAHPATTLGSAYAAPDALTTAYPPSVAHVIGAPAPAPTLSLKPGVSSVACGVAPARSVPACDVAAAPAAARCSCGPRLCGCGDCGSQPPPRSVPPPRSPSDSPSAAAAKPKTGGASARGVRAEGAGRRALGKQLLRAAHEGRAGDVRRLLDAGAPPNFTQGSLWTALHRAAWGGHAATVALLVARGGDVGARTAQGFTPLHVAAYNDPGGRCVHALLQGGADARAANACGWTALHYAAECGDAAAVRLLLAAGACPRARNQADKTPADLARAPPVRQLLQHAALALRDQTASKI